MICLIKPLWLTFGIALPTGVGGMNSSLLLKGKLTFISVILFFDFVRVSRLSSVIFQSCEILRPFSRVCYMVRTTTFNLF
jgi:hypothetical protein